MPFLKTLFVNGGLALWYSGWRQSPNGYIIRDPGDSKATLSETLVGLCRFRRMLGVYVRVLLELVILFRGIFCVLVVHFCNFLLDGVRGLNARVFLFHGIF